MPAMSDVHVPVFCAEATLQHPCASIQEVGKLVRKSYPIRAISASPPMA